MTAWRCAVLKGNPNVLRLLLQAGADPTKRSKVGKPPLDNARKRGYQSCVALLEAAVAEPERPRTLLKARALLDAPPAIDKAFADAQAQGLRRAAHQQAVLAAAPEYLRGRVALGQRLPRLVSVQEREGNEEVVACVKYALGLEGGGGVVFEGQEPTVGMVKEVFVELCELLVPKWARAEM